MFKRMVCEVFHLLLDRIIYDSAEKDSEMVSIVHIFRIFFNGTCNYAIVTCPGAYTHQKG